MRNRTIDSKDICFMNNLLSIEGFFSFIKTNGGEIKNTYYKLPNLLEKYLNICKSVKGELKVDINKFYYAFAYTYNIYEDPENSIFDAFYRILWNVEKISSIVKKYKVPTEEFCVDDLHKVLTVNALRDIKEEHLHFAEKNNEPICIVKFEPYYDLKRKVDLPSEYRDLLILDGNHRLHARFMKNNKSKFNVFNGKYNRIKAYVLPPKIHMELMCNDTIVSIYKINANINFLREYTIGNISESELEERLYQI